MIVKMLTHLHLLVHTWWCWHTLRKRWSLKGREWFRFLRIWRFWENETYIFYCVSGMFGQVTGVFLTGKHSSDALTTGIGCWAYASGVLSVSGKVNSEHQTLSTGRGLDTVRTLGKGWRQQESCECFWLRAPDAWERVWWLRSVTSRVW